MTNTPNNLKSLFYAGIITDRSLTESKGNGATPCLYGLKSDDINRLQDGDVILINTDGRLNLLWEVDTNDNAILATERCNSNCIMCPQPPRKDQAGLQDLNLQIIRLLNSDKIKSICITGGEPTLLGIDFINLIAECKKRLPNVPLAVLTNGKSFKDFDFTKKVIEVGHNDITFCVALYSDHDKGHDDIVRIGGSFYETIKGITNLALFNQKIEIRYVITAKNYSRLPQFAGFIYRNFPFVVHIAFMGMEMTGYARDNYDQVWIDPIDYMNQLSHAVKYLNQRNMFVSIYNLQLCLLPKELWKYSAKSISKWKNNYLDICDKCDYTTDCGGFFTTSGDIKSKNISPMKKS